MANVQGGVRSETIVCRRFLRSKCTRGDGCPFYHPEYNLSADNPTVFWLNFCPAFQRGQCFQQDCRFFHITREEEDTYRLRKDIAPTLLEQAMRKALLLDVALTGTRATCKGFLQGGCSLPMCPYRHVSRHEFANEVLNTLRNEFEIVLGPSVPDIPPVQQFQPPHIPVANNPPMMNPMMGGMGQAPFSGNRNMESPEEKMRRLEQENEAIYSSLDPNQKANSLEEIRTKLLTLQAALTWKGENDANKGGFIDDGLPPGMAVVNYGHSNANIPEPSIDLMRRRDPLPMQPMQPMPMFGRVDRFQGHPDVAVDNYNLSSMDTDLGGNNRSDSDDCCKLFVGGLDSKTDTDSLREHFSRFGDLVDAVVMRNKNLNKSRGFGFVTFSQGFMAENVLRNGPHRVDGKVVDTKYANARPADGGGRAASPKRSERSGRRSPDRDANRVSRLFVGGLNDEINTEVLTDYFERYGSIVDSVSMTDPKTKRSRGFGFVEFRDEESTHRVLSDSPHRIMGILVTVDRPNPRDGSGKRISAPQQSQKSAGNPGDVEPCKMFVGGLNFSTNEGTLRDYFSRFGNILELKIHRDNNGLSKGFGFIQYGESGCVRDAMDSGPHEVDGRRVDTGFASKRSDGKNNRDNNKDRNNERRRSPDVSMKKLEAEDECKLYVGNIPKTLSEDDIEKYFMQFGDVRNIEMKSIRGPKSFCFVTFDDPDMVGMALSAAPHEIDGCSIDVGKAVTKGGKGGDRGPTSDSRRGKSDRNSSSGGTDQPSTLFVGNLNFDAAEEVLYDYFTKYGEIKEIKVNEGTRGSPKGYGFITFADEMCVKEAMDDGPHTVDGVDVKVGNAFSKGQERRDGDRRQRNRSPGSPSPSSRTKGEKRKAEKRLHLD